MLGRAAVRALKTRRPARLLQGLLALCLRPILLKQLRQAHARLKLYRIHRHDCSPVRDPGDIFSVLSDQVIGKRLGDPARTNPPNASSPSVIRELPVS
jgi:hypothetical protein